jgi:hypothetical protein
VTTTTTDIATEPRYSSHIVDGDPQDGYWIHAADINGDGHIDLVASGLTTGEVVWYENPQDDHGTWRKHHIIKLDKSVALDCGDIADEGRMDIVICHDYGKCMFDCRPQDGKISWLRNPGTFTNNQQWQCRRIGDLVATHRLSLGHFRQNPKLELMAIPVVGPAGGREGLDQSITLMLYERPDDVLNAKGWSRRVVDSAHFRIVHGVVTDQFAGSPHPELDSLLLASEEGITWFGMGEQRAWEQRPLGSGAPLQNEQVDIPRRFKGTGNLAVGRLGDNSVAYIAAIEPFHGNTVAIYTQTPSPSGGITGLWRRTTLAVFGDPDQPGLAVGHHVVTADLDGDGNDEFLVALRGPAPWQGVLQYKPTIEKGILTSCCANTVSTSSAARITVADFTGDGRLDFATTGYYTEGYYKTEKPEVRIFYNQYSKPSHAKRPKPANG